MASCIRCRMRKSIRVVNVLVNVFGMATIVYSLWLLKKWQIGVSELPNNTHSNFIKPWFIHACLGVGIGVCLSTLFGHIVTNSMKNGSTLFCIYILFICSLVLLQIVVIVAVFFKIDWVSELSKYLDQNNAAFETLMKINISICRLIVIIALIPQIYVIILGMISWVKGRETMNSSNRSYVNISDFGQSFLVGPNSPINHRLHICCGDLLLLDSQPQRNSTQRFLPYIIGAFRTHFPPRTRDIGG